MQMKNAQLFVAIGMLALALSAGSAAAAQSESPRTPDAHSVVYREESVIAASPETIYGVIIDLASYPAWNPWITRAQGSTTPGGAVSVDVVLNGSTQKAEHTVIVVEPSTRFCWKDAGWTAVLAPAQRCRTLALQADGTVVYRNELIIFGILARLVDLTNGNALRTGMAAENAALKRRVESR